MTRQRTPVALVLAGVALALAACSSASSATPVALSSSADSASAAACQAKGGSWDGMTCEMSTPLQTTDPNGQACAAPDMDSQGNCPGDTPTQQTDPNGQTCASLDSQGYCPGDDPSPTPTMTKQADVVVFKVWGSGEPTIQYGTDSSENNPNDGAGPLGDGNYLPWRATMPYDSGALYYAVSAQLEGSGSIQDSVTEVVTTWCSGSKPKTETFSLANGSASGGYAIAQAEYTGGDTGNASQAEQDAGC
jgi:hypothetical protein